MLQAHIQYASYSDFDVIEAETLPAFTQKLTDFAHDIVTSKDIPDLQEGASLTHILSHLRRHFGIIVEPHFP